MIDNRGFGYLSSSALSLTAAANTGISPVLPLYLLGLVGFLNSDLLNMGDLLDTILASWCSLIVLGLLALGEIACKCIPALDKVIDSVEVFVVPILSMVATLATMGLLSSPSGESGSETEVESESDGFRYLQENNNNNNNGVDDGTAFLTVLKVLLVVGGMVLIMLMHFFNIVLRVFSLLCGGGCCQPALRSWKSSAFVSRSSLRCCGRSLRFLPYSLF